MDAFGHCIDFVLDKLFRHDKEIWVFVCLFHEVLFDCHGCFGLTATLTSVHAALSTEPGRLSVQAIVKERGIFVVNRDAVDLLHQTEALSAFLFENDVGKKASKNAWKSVPPPFFPLLSAPSAAMTSLWWDSSLYFFVIVLSNSILSTFMPIISIAVKTLKEAKIRAIMINGRICQAINWERCLDFNNRHSVFLCSQRARWQL